MSSAGSIEGKNPQVWAKERARELLQAAGHSGLPVDLATLFPICRISPDVMPEPHLKYRGRLTHIQDGFQIAVDKDLSRVQRRFTVAHEIGHSYFFELDSSPMRRRRVTAPRRLIERACDIFAAELLMPSELVRQQYGQASNFCDGDGQDVLSSIVRLGAEFDVSLRAMARRVVDELGLWDGVLLACRWLPKFINQEWGRLETIESGVDQAWRIHWSVISPELSNEVFIPRPSRWRKGLPKLRWRILDQLSRDLQSGSCRVIEVESSDIAKVGNLRGLMRQRFGDRPAYPVNAMLLGRANLQLEFEAVIHSRSPESFRNCLLLLFAISIPEG